MKKLMYYIIAAFVVISANAVCQDKTTYHKIEKAKQPQSPIHSSAKIEDDTTTYHDLTFISCVPNPAVDITHFKFYLPEKATVEIDIFNTMGQKVLDVISNIVYEAGENDTPEIDLRKIPSGKYECRITTLNKTVSKSLVITR